MVEIDAYICYNWMRSKGFLCICTNGECCAGRKIHSNGTWILTLHEKYVNGVQSNNNICQRVVDRRLLLCVRACSPRLVANTKNILIKWKTQKACGFANRVRHCAHCEARRNEREKRSHLWSLLPIQFHFVCVCVFSKTEVCRQTSAMKIRLDNIMPHTINSGEWIRVNATMQTRTGHR